MGYRKERIKEKRKSSVIMTVQELIEQLRVQDKDTEVYIPILNRVVKAKRSRNILIPNNDDIEKALLIE